MEVTFNIEGYDYKVTAYRLIMDWSDQYIKEHNNGNTGANVGDTSSYLWSGHFTEVRDYGTYVDLRQAFYDTYMRLREDGVYVDTTSDPHTMMNIKLGGDETPSANFDYNYTYIYAPADAAKLKVIIYGGTLDPDNAGGGTRYGTYEIIINYNGEPVLQEKLTCHVIRHINRLDSVNNNDSIVIGGLTGCCKPVRGANWTYGPSGIQVSYDLNWQYITYDMWDPVEPGLLVPPPLITTNYFGYAPLYLMPLVEDASIPIGTVLGTSPQTFPTTGGNNNIWGAVFLYSAYRIRINNTLLDVDTPADSQSDNTNPHGYNDKTFYDTSDYLPDDGLPSSDALDTGFIHAYSMTPGNAHSLANYMLTDSFIQGVKHLMADPIDYIVSFVMLPVEPDTTSSANIMIGGVDTEITAYPVTNQFKRVSLGSIKCAELWKGFPDYAPATRVSIYLPMIGIRELSVDDVMDGTLEVVYRIDVLTGEFICTLCSNTSRALNGIIAAYNGTMGMDIPITAVNYQNKLNALTSAVSGGFGVTSGVVTGNALGVAQGTAGAALGIAEAALSKPTIERSSSLSGSSGVLGNYTPYLIIERPVQALPKNYAKLKGYASKIGGSVSDFTGYAEFESVELKGIACTDSERSEILSLLKGGVFV